LTLGTLPTATISSVSESSSTVTVTTSGTNSFTVGEIVTISGVGTSGYNGVFAITSVNSNNNTFTYIDSNTGLGSDSSGGTAKITLNGVIGNSTGADTAAITSVSESGSSVTVTTSGANNFTLGEIVTISGVGTSGFNGTFVIRSVKSNNTFTYIDSNTGLGTDTSGGVASITPNSVVGSGTSTITLTGSQATINAALSGLTYTPGAGFYGTTTLAVSTNDNGNSGFGGPQTDSRSTTITVVGLFLSEIFLNTSSNLSSPSANQYLEVFSTVGGYTIPSSVYVVGIQGNNSEVTDQFANDTVNKPGDVTDLFKLGGFKTGSNGYLALLQKGEAYPAGDINSGGSVLTNAGTQAGFGNGGGSSSFGTLGGVHTGQDQNGVGVRLGTNPDLPGDGATASGELSWDMQQGSVSYLLIQASSAPTVQHGTTDNATNIDGGSSSTATVAGGTAYNSWNVLDGVGILASPLSPTTGTYTQNGPDRSYAPITFQAGDDSGTVMSGSNLITTGSSSAPWTATYVGRIDQNTGSSSADWLASVPLATGSSSQPFKLDTTKTTSASTYGGQPLNSIGGPNFWADQMHVAVNDGTSNQHSQVSELTLTFAAPVTLTGVVSKFTVTAATDNGSTAGTATLTVASHNFVVGQSVTVTGITGTGWIGQKLITAVTSTSITFARGSITANGTTGSTSAVTALNTTTTGGTNGSTTFNNIFQVLSTVNISSATESSNTVTVTTSTPLNFTAGETVTINGVSVMGSTSNAYNGTFMITSAGSNTFTYTDGTTGLGNGSGGTGSVPVQILVSIPTGGGTYNAAAGTGTNVSTLVVRFLATGNLTLSFTGADGLGNKVGLNDGNYFLTTDATKVTDAQGKDLDGAHNGTFGSAGNDEFWRLFGDVNGTRTVDALDAAFFGAHDGSTTATASGNIGTASQSGRTVTVTVATSSLAGSLGVGDRVTIGGVTVGSSSTTYNGTFVITSVNSANGNTTFTYNTPPSMTGLGSGTGGTYSTDTTDYLWYLDFNMDGALDFNNTTDSTAFFNNRYGRNGGTHTLSA
jgi:hypothetical protein